MMYEGTLIPFKRFVTQSQENKCWIFIQNSNSEFKVMYIRIIAILLLYIDTKIIDEKCTAIPNIALLQNIFYK